MKMVFWFFCSAAVIIILGLMGRQANAQPRITDPSSCIQLQDTVDWMLKNDRQLQSDALTLKSEGVARLKTTLCSTMAAVKSEDDFRALLDANDKKVRAIYAELAALFETNGNVERLRALPPSNKNRANQLELFMSAADAKKGYEIMDRETVVGAQQRVLGWVFLKHFRKPYKPPA
jgi:hypothetical protein